eukprot:744290-Amorphochlora_amoeboformis.AAC.2
MFPILVPSVLPIVPSTRVVNIQRDLRDSDINMKAVGHCEYESSDPRSRREPPGRDLVAFSVAGPDSMHTTSTEMKSCHLDLSQVGNQFRTQAGIRNPRRVRLSSWGGTSAVWVYIFPREIEKIVGDAALTWLWPNLWGWRLGVGVC